MVKKGNIPWNKGLTKETDERIAKQARKVSGKGSPMFGKKYEMTYYYWIRNNEW